MKKAKFNTKLSLSKETIVKLNNDQLSLVKGGEAEGPTTLISWIHRCYTQNTCTTTRTTGI